MKKQRNAVSFLVAIEIVVLIIALILVLVNPFRARENKHEKELLNGNDNSIEENSQIAEGEEVESTTEKSVVETPSSETENEITEERLTFSARVEEKLNVMTVEELAAQVFMITPEALTGVGQVTASGNTTKVAYEKYPVAGIVYSEINFQNKNQSRIMLSRMQQIATDRIGFSLLIGKSEEWDPNSDTAKQWIESYQPNQMVSMVNILSTDISDGSVNSKLEQTEPGNLPMCQDIESIFLLRKDLNYNGLLLTDSCVSLTGEEVGTSSVKALKAGVDLIYLPGDFTAAYSAVVNAIQTGEISSDRIHNAVGRVLTAKEAM